MDTQIISPFIKHPALTAFYIVSVLYIALNFPLYALPLAIAAFFIMRHLPKWLLKICLIFLILSAVSLFIENRRIHSFEQNLKSPLPNKGVGIIEKVTPKQNGFTLFIKTDFGKIRLTNKNENTPLPGDSVLFSASYFPIEPVTVKGAFDTKKWLFSQKLRAYGKLENFEILCQGNSIERYFFTFRKWLHARIKPFCSNEATGLLMGLFAGDRSLISDTLQNDFRRSGLMHVLAISGFHVVLLSGMLLLFLKSLRIPHHLARIFSILLLLIYIPITGGSAAVSRAVLMFSIVEGGALLERRASSLNSLGLALLIIVLYAPSEIFNPGFQLSAAASAGIIIGQKKNPLKRICKALSKYTLGSIFSVLFLETSYVTFCATLSTLPFLTYHFQSIAPLSILGNLIVVPCISLAMYAGLFLIVSPFDFLRENFGNSAEFLLKLASLLTKELSNSPKALLTVGPFPLFIICLFSLCLICLVLKDIRFYRRLFIIMLLSMVLFFLVHVFQFYFSPKWELTLLDVDQADSVLLETPLGKSILFDVGLGDRKPNGYVSKRNNAAKNKIIPYLRYKGVRSLDAVVITHADAEHYGGLEELIDNFPVKEVWISECSQDLEKTEWMRVLSKVYGKAISVRNVGAGFYFKEKHLTLRALHPMSKKSTRCDETNKESVTFLIEGLGHSALLTGDLTKEGEAEILNRLVLNPYLTPKADFLKLGHHGSKTSSSVAFLSAVAPYYAVASSGKKNPYRHPHKVVTDRLDSMQIPWLNTAKSGSVTLLVNSLGMSISTETEDLVKFIK